MTQALLMRNPIRVPEHSVTNVSFDCPGFLLFSGLRYISELYTGIGRQKISSEPHLNLYWVIEACRRKKQEASPKGS